MKKITAVFVIFAIAVCLFTACAKKPQGTEQITIQGGDTIDLITKEGGGLDRDDEGNPIEVVTNDKGKAVTEKDGKQVTVALDLEESCLVYDNKIEFKNYSLEIPNGWSNCESYNNTNIKKNDSDDGIQITRLTDTTFEKKYDDVKKLYAASVGMYPDAVTEEKGIKVGDMNCTRYELYIPKTSNDKPLYTCYILIEHDAALYQILISATRDLREDFGEIEKILNSIQFK